ncbi:hypothetical protein [Entomomonas asaccharolytica]|uniref:DUF1444 family protein n=1 Tax=Entomomonas asaccharolytica TaxID=2785331 RepID=A0A974NFP1_9GAMM|nr:hypothetical protein [Entomomonas asaccharolytica]QQP85632.1 hypothetical protein JHT90_14890 [Entomomonas asaccharolytica]
MGFFSKLFSKTSSQAKLTKKKLTEDLVEQLKQYIPEIKATISHADEPDNISVSIERPEGDPIIFYPDNLYYAYLQGNEDFTAYKNNIIQNICDIFHAVDEEPILLPTIKPISWLDEVYRAIYQANPNAKEDPLVYLPLAGDLIIVFALDMSTRMSYLYHSQLADYSADNDLQALYLQALENFKTKLDHIEIYSSDIGYTLTLDGNYDASLVLTLEQLLPSLELKGEPIIAIIARNQLIIADSYNSQQVSMLNHYAKQQMQEAPYALSAELFCLKDNKLSLYNSLQ